MTPTDAPTRAERDRLRALAEKAHRDWTAARRYTEVTQSKGDPRRALDWLPASALTQEGMGDSYADWIAACSPSVVLSLLDALDASERGCPSGDDACRYRCPECAATRAASTPTPKG